MSESFNVKPKKETEQNNIKTKILKLEPACSEGTWKNYVVILWNNLLLRNHKFF